MKFLLLLLLPVFGFAQDVVDTIHTTKAAEVKDNKKENEVESNTTFYLYNGTSTRKMRAVFGTTTFEVDSVVTRNSVTGYAGKYYISGAIIPGYFLVLRDNVFIILPKRTFVFYN